MTKNDVWKRSGTGLFCYQPTGIYFARVRFGSKLYRRTLGTSDYQLARRKLAEFKHDLERTDARAGKTTLGAMVRRYEETTLAFRAAGTQDNKRMLLEKLRRTFFGIDSLPLRQIRPSDIAGWLARNCGGRSEAYFNDSLSTLRQILDLAVADRIIAESPALGLKYRKRSEPIRSTPTYEEFRAIVADIRSQTLNRERDVSGDFVEFMGLAGLGQAEIASLKRGDVDLKAGRLTIYRHKTATGFVVPLFPQLRPLVERLCEGKGHSAPLFPIREARKALENACKRLGFPHFTHRSLRRMFITRCIERGIDVKVIAEWQGHRDGGKLILQTYSHVSRPHSDAMAARLVADEDEPENIVHLPRQMAGTVK